MSGRGVWPVIDFIKQRSKFTPCRRVSFLNERFQNCVLPFVHRLVCARRRGNTTARTPVVMRGERRPAVSTGFSNLVGSVVPFDDASFAEDILGVFRRRDVLVGFPHVGVERPVDPVFDLGPTVALADHPRNGRVAEGVRFDVGVQVGPVGDPSELLTQGVGIDTPVITPPAVTLARRGLDLVEQCHVRVVGSRVRCPKVGPNGRRRVDQRVLRNRRALQSRRVAVRRVRRRVRQVDILDTKRQGQRESRARVREELDESNVTLMPRRGRERLNVSRRENVVRTQRVALGPRSVNVVRPLNAGHVFEIEDNGRFVGFDGAVRKIVVVAKIENKVVEIALVKFDDGRLRSFARKANSTEIGFQARNFDRPALLAQPVVNRAAVRFVDSRACIEATAFVLQTLRKILRVVSRHTPTSDWCYYKLPTRESTSSISFEIAEEQPDRRSKSTSREKFLDQFEGDRRMREAARTDPLQTHLNPRDAETWGGAAVA